jgi:hypothetical protein
MNRILTWFVVGHAMAGGIENSMTGWVWFRASANVESGWTIQRGFADVVLSTKSFKARLRDENAQSVTIVSLVGSVAENSVTARLTVIGTDYDQPHTVTGKIRRSCSTDGGWESIVFEDTFEVLGLNHELTASECRRTSRR